MTETPKSPYGELDEVQDAVPEQQPPPHPARRTRAAARTGTGTPASWATRPPQRGPTPAWVKAVRPRPPGPIRIATLWSAVATGVLAALFLGDGIGVNLLIVALPTALAAAFAAVNVGRQPRPGTLLWAGAGLALLVVPAVYEAGWPVFLAVTAAIGAGGLALSGGRGWLAVLLGPVGLFTSAPGGIGWAAAGVRERAAGSRARWLPLVRTGGIALALLLVFGALFAGADAAFADLLGGLAPDVSVGDSPWRFFLFLAGLVWALATARAAAAPLRWDRVKTGRGKPHGRVEWALPLVILCVLFAAFLAVQLVVLLGGYDTVLEKTDLSYAEYARQGFWQLLWVTLLVLVVIALALRWAPRAGQRDALLVRGVLGTLCALALVVVASALRRMDLYVDAYGLTRLRLSVAAMELWLGVVLVLIMAAGVFGARRLPRAVAGSAAAGVLAFGLMSPDALIAEQNVARFERSAAGFEAASDSTATRAYEDRDAIDLGYLDGLSADAVPALDRLPEPQRSCVLRQISYTLPDEDAPWYAVSWSERRALDILERRPVQESTDC